MGARYIPPHLRKQVDDLGDKREADAEGGDQPPGGLGLRRLADLHISKDNDMQLNTLAEIHRHYGDLTLSATLHYSAEQPGSLAFVVLFRGANPRWKDDNIIFAHTNINFLPGYTEFKLDKTSGLPSRGDEAGDNVNPGDDDDSANSTDVPKSATVVPDSTTDTTDGQARQKDFTPVYMELNLPRGISRRYKFHGFFTISKVDFLRPHSPELVRMLQQKWGSAHTDCNNAKRTTRARDPAAWKSSLDQEWAVVKFKQVPKDAWPAEPQIEVLPEEIKDVHRSEESEVVAPGEFSTQLNESLGRGSNGKVADDAVVENTTAE